MGRSWRVLDALSEYGAKMTSPLPPGAVGARAASDWGALHRLVRRAYQLSRSRPDEPLKQYQKEAARVLGTTEAERLVRQRVGQGVFRKRLLPGLSAAGSTLPPLPASLCLGLGLSCLQGHKRLLRRG